MHGYQKSRAPDSLTHGYIQSKKNCNSELEGTSKREFTDYHGLLWIMEYSMTYSRLGLSDLSRNPLHTCLYLNTQYIPPYSPDSFFYMLSNTCFTRYTWVFHGSIRIARLNMHHLPANSSPVKSIMHSRQSDPEQGTCSWWTESPSQKSNSM